MQKSFLKRAPKMVIGSFQNVWYRLQGHKVFKAIILILILAIICVPSALVAREKFEQRRWLQLTKDDFDSNTKVISVELTDTNHFTINGLSRFGERRCNSVSMSCVLALAEFGLEFDELGGDWQLEFHGYHKDLINNSNLKVRLKNVNLTSDGGPIHLGSCKDCTELNPAADTFPINMSIEFQGENKVGTKEGTSLPYVKGSAIQVSSKSKLYVTGDKKSTLSIQQPNDQDGSSIGGPPMGPSGEIVIEGKGTVNATAGGTSAAIGSGNGNKASPILIGDNAIVNATGAKGSAAIGGGAYGSAERIIITKNAHVTAESGESDAFDNAPEFLSGAAIGGGATCDSGEILIDQSTTVVATGAPGAPAIGAGGGPTDLEQPYHCSENSTSTQVTIGGSTTVIAMGGKDAAGIGGGNHIHSGWIEINGGTVISEAGGESTDDIGSLIAPSRTEAAVVITNGNVYLAHNKIAAPRNGHSIEQSNLVYPVFVPTGIQKSDSFDGVNFTDKEITIDSPYWYKASTLSSEQTKLISEEAPGVLDAKYAAVIWPSLQKTTTTGTHDIKLNGKKITAGFTIEPKFEPDENNTFKHAISVEKVEVNNPASVITIKFSDPLKDLIAQNIKSEKYIDLSQNLDGKPAAQPKTSPVEYKIIGSPKPSSDFKTWTITVEGTVSGDINFWIQKTAKDIVYEDTKQKLTLTFKGGGTTNDNATTNYNNDSE